jgi:hypothetical protein
MHHPVAILERRDSTGSEPNPKSGPETMPPHPAVEPNRDLKVVRVEARVAPCGIGWKDPGWLQRKHTTLVDRSGILDAAWEPPPGSVGIPPGCRDQLALCSKHRRVVVGEPSA